MSRIASYVPGLGVVPADSMTEQTKADLIHEAETVPVVTERAETECDDSINPAHYKQGGIECIDCIKAALGDNFIGFLIGNVIKYVYRYKHKNGVTDLEKASVYLKWAIEEMKKNETT